MIIADVHLHSRFSRATSKNLDLFNLEKWAKVKGITLLGTGDFTHPAWLNELKEHLEEDGSGILKTKSGFAFMLQTEISNIYSQDGKLKKIHNVLLAPSFEIVDQINELLGKKGNLLADGRPIFGRYPCYELTEDLKKISNDIEIIPAHAWTPWFSVFGSNSGFDSVQDCFKDQTKHIYALETGMSCYDPKTEVLTSNGWKKIDAVKISDVICTLNIKKNKIEFQKPINLFKYKYKGKMYRLKTKRVNLLVTPNHNLLCSHCDFRKPVLFSLKPAKFLFKRSKRFKKDGIWPGKNPKYFSLPAVKVKHGSRYYSGFRLKKAKKFKIKQWLKFFGFWIAEGWTTAGKNGDYGVYLVNSNSNLISEMKKILEYFGYDAYHYKNKGLGTIRVRDYQLFHYLKQFGKSNTKFIPKEIKMLSKNLLGIFFDYYIKGDGHKYGRNGKGLSATTNSIFLRDDLQEIALKMGISAYYKLHSKKNTPITSLPHAKLRGYKQSADTWVVYFIRKNIHTVLPSTIKKYNYTEKWVNYDGLVYCLEVPNHTIYVRRNGIPVWCGNSDPAMNWRLSQLDKFNLVSNSDAHSFWPWRIGRECNVFDTKLEYKEIVNAIRTKKGFAYTIEVDPNYGKYHFDGHRSCNVSLNPQETKKLNNICPECKRPLTIGVLNRIEELADREEGFKPENAVPFKTLLPLHELIALVLKTPLESKRTWQEYNKLIEAFGSEFNILLDVPIEKLVRITTQQIANLILKNREGKIKVKPGFDGVYGEPLLEPEQQKLF